MPEKWEKKSEKKIISNTWLEISKEGYDLPDGSHISDFYVIEERAGVNIVAVTPQMEVIVVKQFRPAIGKMFYDFPAGMIEESDNNPLDRAKEELLEETGFTSTNWIKTGIIHPAPHRFRKTEHCFLAQNIKKVGSQKLDQTEFIKYELLSIEKLKELIKVDQFTCGVCIASFFKALQFLEGMSL